MKRTIEKGRLKPSITISTYEVIKFIDKNSDMGWNDICDFVNREGYLTDDCNYGMGQWFGSKKPNKGRVEKHGCDYEYEFMEAHPELKGCGLKVLFDD